MEKIKSVFNWSGGKDSAFALYKVLQSGLYDVVALLTTVNSSSSRSTMHDIPLELLNRQASSIGIPLYVVNLSPASGMDEYNKAMSDAVLHFKEQGVTTFIFGDIFLYDVRKYREDALRPLGIDVLEPLWDKSSQEVMEEFLQSGLKTIIVTTTATVLGREYIGRHIDESLIKDLPESADVCGEQGEYHTFCYDGPIFSHPVRFTLGQPYEKSFPIKLDDGTEQTFSYWFADLGI